MALKNFEEYVQEGIVNKVKPDYERAKSLVKTAERKMRSLIENIQKVGIKDENANDYIEYCYDTLMILIRAKMLLKGYNSSGFKAHEAEVSYMRVLGFKENDVRAADQMRFFRNGILYYGTILDKEYAEKVVSFTKENYQKLKALS